MLTDVTNIMDSQDNSEVLLKSHICQHPPIYPSQLDDTVMASASFSASESHAIASH